MEAPGRGSEGGAWIGERVRYRQVIGDSCGGAIVEENGKVPANSGRRQQAFDRAGPGRLCVRSGGQWRERAGGGTATVRAVVGSEVAWDQAWALKDAQGAAYYWRKDSKARKCAGELEGALVPGFGSRGFRENTSAFVAAVHQMARGTERARTQASWVCSQKEFLRGLAEAAGGGPTGTGPGATPAVHNLSVSVTRHICFSSALGSTCRSLVPLFAGFH